jgi:hypothetical protein
MPDVMSRLTQLQTKRRKGFALAGVLLIGFLPGAAQAKWIKATVTGNIDATGATADNLTAGSQVSLNFVIQNYGRTSTSVGGTNSWKQTTGKHNYSQLFNFGTGTNSTGLQSNYNASTTPDGTGNIFQSKDDGTDFLMRVSGTPSSGLYITRSGARTDISSIEVSGVLGGFASTVPSSLDVVDFLSASTTNNSYNCGSANCNGTIQPTGSSESPITFKWTSVKFEQVQAVPGPLPLTGVLAAFRFSRKIRTRIKSC